MEANKDSKNAPDASTSALVGEKRTAEEAGLDLVPEESSEVVAAPSEEPVPAPAPSPVPAPQQPPVPVPAPQQPVVAVVPSPVAVRPRLTYDNKEKKDRTVAGASRGGDRWRVHRQAEDYVNLVGDIMYPSTMFSPFSNDIEKKGVPMARITTLGYLVSPLRRPSTIMEKWSPYEISIFEAAITLFGKNFNRIQKYIETKTVKQVIEFYYCWKKTGHYKQWKAGYVPDDREQPAELKPEPRDFDYNE